MKRNPAIRILHVDGDSFFASCETALHQDRQGRPVWVGGGRRGDGIVIAAIREAKKFGITAGMACFKAKRLCPDGVLAKPHYEEYRRLSQEIFRILEEYTPTIVPISSDEGFLDFTTTDQHVWRNITPASFVREFGSVTRNARTRLAALRKSSLPRSRSAEPEGAGVKDLESTQRF